MATIQFFHFLHLLVAEEVEIKLVTELVNSLGQVVALVVAAAETKTLPLVALALHFRATMVALALLEPLFLMVVAVVALVALAQWGLLVKQRATEEMVELA